MAKDKIKTETVEEKKIIPSEVKKELCETYNLAEAEQLQKDGWRLLDIAQTSNGKLYKFER